jgi:5-methylcytosine-specific restriction endonuclease McrA
LRAARLRIDGYRCVVPGCGRLAVVVDHIVSRKIGGTDTLDNLHSLCRAHDNQVKEAASGIRRTDGNLIVRDCDADGWPLDQNHPWHKR